MKLPSAFPRLKGFRFPRDIVAYAVWAYHRFALSAADVEDLLAERGVIVSRETVRLWINRFGRHLLAAFVGTGPSQTTSGTAIAAPRQAIHSTECCSLNTEAIGRHAGPADYPVHTSEGDARWILGRVRRETLDVYRRSDWGQIGVTRC